MTIKRLVALIIILNFIILSISFVAAKPDNTNNPKEFVKQFLCAKMNTLVTKNVDAIDEYYSSQSSVSQKYMMFTKQELLQDYLIAYASNDYIIEKVTPQVKIISSTDNGDVVTVHAILKTVIYWNAANALGKPIIGNKSEKHLLTLSKENKEWKIIVDQYMTSRGHSEQSVKQDFNRFCDTIENLKKEAEDALDRSKRSKSTRLTMASSEAQNKNGNKNSMLSIDRNPYTKGISKSMCTFINKNILVASSCISNSIKPTATSTYDRAGAYNWAHTYWDNYSVAYVNLGAQKWQGGDCTNFISQCLRAGDANNDKTGSYQWYYDSKGNAESSDDSYSWTWSTARGLNYIIMGNYKANEYGPKGTEKVITGDLEYNSSIGEYIMPGDIIQYQWKASLNITHSAIIVDMLYNSSKERYEPVIAEHTNDSWYTPWTNNAYKTHFVHITGVN